MKYTDNLIKEIPLDKKEYVLKKMKSFERVLLENVNLNDVPKGFWVRKIKGTDIYKFRVNSGDRILFSYEEKEKKKEIVFRAYCNHDEQIRRGKRIRDINIEKSDEIFILKDEYREDNFDIQIDNYVKNEMCSKLEMIKKDVIEDEYIGLSVEVGEVNFLSLEQFECIEETNNSVIVLGCAGSGKTNIGIRKLALDRDINMKSCYITCSETIKENIKKIYSNFRNEDDEVEFFTFKSLCFNILKNNKITVIEYYEFYKWVLENKILEKYPLNLGSLEIWAEINTTIKGGKADSKIIDRKEYVDEENSRYSLKAKKKLYGIAREYQVWLNTNEYMDYNDLAFEAIKKLKEFEKYEGIVLDEAQELTQKQLELVLSICEDKKNMIFLGDTNQTLSIKGKNTNIIKAAIYDKNQKVIEKLISKNYRNTLGVVKWLNGLKQIKKDNLKNMGKEVQNLEIAIRDGENPKILYKLDNEKKFFEKANKMVNGIIIVANEEVRNKLEKEKIGIGRVFTVLEVRGLEYDKVYCYNIASNYNEMWNEILASEEKYEEEYARYFNILYICATRAKKEVYFIENKTTKINEMLDEFYNVIDEETILKSVEEVSDINEWLDEARKLQMQQKYYQAYEAYKKAGEIKKADTCLKAYRRELTYKNKEKYTSYIVINRDEITQELIEDVLRAIIEKYKATIIGYIEIYRRELGTRLLAKATRYIEYDKELRDIAIIIKSEVVTKEFSQKNIYIKCCFYNSESEPIDMKKKLGNNYEDLEISWVNGNLQIKEFNFKLGRDTSDKEKERELEIRKIVGETLINEASMQLGKEKYKDKNEKDILTYIFDNKKL
ncbi:MAG: UvrD-helicase domain-containing protein [Clostridium sp.]